MTDNSMLVITDDAAGRLGQCYARLVELGRRRRERLTGRSPGADGTEARIDLSDAPAGPVDTIAQDRLDVAADRLQKAALRLVERPASRGDQQFAVARDRRQRRAQFV